MATETTVRLSYTTRLSVLTCGNCSIPFAIPKNLHEKVMADGSRFYCPNGHHISYSETENERLERKLADQKRWLDARESQLTHERDQRRAAEYQARAYKGQVTKIRKRIGNGVCPSCNRHFTDVERHMRSQHPGYTEGTDG